MYGFVGFLRMSMLRNLCTSILNFVVNKYHPQTLTCKGAFSGSLLEWQWTVEMIRIIGMIWKGIVPNGLKTFAIAKGLTSELFHSAHSVHTAPNQQNTWNTINYNSWKQVTHQKIHSKYSYSRIKMILIWGFRMYSFCRHLHDTWVKNTPEDQKT